jgi:hypothetical protein
MAQEQLHLNKTRIDKFILSFNLPPILQEDKRDELNSTNDLQDGMQFSVYGVVVPSMTVPEIATPYAGQTAKTSSFTRPAYDNVSVNFNIDNRFLNYYIIHKWLNVLNHEQTSIYDNDDYLINERGRVQGNGINATDIEYKKEYTANMSLFGLDEYNVKIVQFTYTEAFPIALGGINYNYQDEVEIACTFDFAFSQLHFKRLAIS